ncbi:ArsA family ATPase [Salinibacter ruber]|uniref:ArsA family ATPase n=1 Tax=Salinibacter ruber TaxID=146919 RepID=UPI002168C6DB|nr:ArsA family ATPase [Salinibacter ruber]MCS3758196.1 arsenite-transporting ATPase [Salinibacter ruber]MCS3954849.1 arsenite-transporting ATPase [Salinibacter ruber]
MLFPASDDDVPFDDAPRILLFTGKGGTGKTTCAAATAQHAARQGHKTLVLSSDPAHSLADALDQELGPEAREVRDRLFAQEVDLYYSMKKHWGHMRELMLTVFRWQGVDQIAAEELAALPGMNEGSVLLWLEEALREADYDLIVVDSAPTGETLTLLTLPQVTQWWLAKAFPFQKMAVKSLGFGVRKATGIPLDKGYEELEVIFEKLERVQQVLATPSTTSIRLVTNPEKMVIEEARRAFTYLQLYGYGVDSVVVNRVLPEDEVPAASFFEGYVESQREYLEEIEQSFRPLPILQVPHLGEEVFGAERLGRIGDAMYAERNPTDVFYDEPTFTVEEDGDAYVLNLRLAFATEADVDVRQLGDQLVVQVVNQRSNVILPNFLNYYHMTSAALEEGWLRVRFTPDGEASSN